MNHHSFPSHSLTYHRFLGIGAAVVGLILSITGCLLVYYHSMVPVVRQYRHQIQPIASEIQWQKVVNTMAKNFPESSIDRLLLPIGRQEAAILRVQTDRGKYDLYFDPQRQELLAQYPVNPPWLEGISHFHSHLTLGKWGALTIGILGLGMAAVVTSGMGLQRKRWMIRWRAKPGLLFYDLHQTVGIGVGLFLLILTVTGAFLGIEKPIHSLLVKKQTNISTVEKLSYDIDWWLGLARLQYPTLKISSINFPKPHDSIMRMQSVQNITLEIDLLRNTISPQPSQSWYKKFKKTIGMLHDGSYGGIVIGLIYLTLGLSMVFMSMSGISLFLLRQIRLVKS